MSLKEISQSELELLTYTDLAELILKESKSAMNTPNIFHKICDLLGLTDNDYTNKIGDFYTSLTTDKRFLLLEGALWDLKDRHVIDIVVEDDDEDDETDEIEEEIEEDTTEEETIEDNYDDEDTLDDDDDDLDDLVVMSEEELNAEQ